MVVGVVIGAEVTTTSFNKVSVANALAIIMDATIAIGVSFINFIDFLM
jgi:hypothetical protein